MQDDRVDLWATDEVHFQQHASRCRMWSPPEIKDPVLLHAPTRKSVGYFGAVRLRDGRFVFRLETGEFNGPKIEPKMILDLIDSIRTPAIGRSLRSGVSVDLVRARTSDSPGSHMHLTTLSFMTLPMKGNCAKER